MKNVFVLWILWSFWSSSVLAQNNSIGQSDPEAKKILDQVSNKYKSYKAIQAAFTLKIEDAQNNVQGSKKGTVYLKGNKYRISITGQEVFSDGTTTWTYDKSANEVTVSKVDPSSNPIQKLFTNFYDQDYLYKLNGDQKMNGRVLEEIELTPVDKTKNFFKIYVYVDKAKKQIASGKMFDKNGNKYTYTINSFNGQAPVSDSTFVFDKSKYPGVEVVDLRE